MRKAFFLIILIPLIVVTLLSLYIIKSGSEIETESEMDTVDQTETDSSNISNISSSQISMKISSPAFGPNESIPSKYTCDGENVNPPLQFQDIPDGTKSLVLIVDDPEAAAGIWVHWLVWNISPEISQIEENSVPANAIQGTTSFERADYGGPCPPEEHSYFFKLYALDVELDLESAKEKKDLEAAMNGHILEKTELIGLYERN